jgi:NitT/TauT family transport system ATP-binding protein
MEIANGEFVVLFGPNACGKTTILNAIAGLIELDSGRIDIGGVVPGEAKVGYIFQNYKETILPWKSVLDNVTYPLALNGISEKERNDRATRLLKDMKISIPLDAWPSQLSGGQQQLLVIARALIYEPDLMLFDEPFSALDVQTRIQMRDKLQEIWSKTKATILFISHEIDEALLLADRVVMLSRRPARSLDIIRVAFARPRTQALLEEEDFFTLRRRALKDFREAMAS